VRGIERDFAMKELVRFEVVGEIVYLVERDSASVETEPDRAFRKSPGIVDPDMPYARELLFLDCRYDAAVLNEGSRRISLLS
jgi:hypothetical protein